MTVAWIDTETTGLDPINSAPFEIACLIYQDKEVDGKRTHQLVDEKVFLFNPLDDEVLFHEGAYKTHGIPEETIRSYPPATEVIPEFVELLKKYCSEEKLIFAGYNCSFDYGHVSGLLFRCGFQMDDYFNGRLIDVYEKVKQAAHLLPKTKNQKLETMTKALDIEHIGAHGALSDIKATRRLYEAIYQLSIRR